MTPLRITPSALAPKAAPDKDPARLTAAAQKFEAIFVRQMLAAARKTDFGGDLLGGQGMDTFRQMQDERFADIASQRGAFGIAKALVAQLSHTETKA
jgi:flagellar protein FlgJ